MKDMTLYQLSGLYRQLLDLEPDQMAAALQELTGDIKDKATNIGFVIGNYEALAESIEDAVKDMKSRAASCRARSDWLRNYLLTNMQATGISKIEGPLLKISLRKNPGKVIIDNEQEIPAQYMRQPPPVLDKIAIGADLKEGLIIPGVHLEVGESVSIRA